MNKFCKVLLAAATVAALAAPAMAADKLIVKDAAGTADVFKVTDAGKIITNTTVTNASYLQDWTNNTIVRSGLRADGVQYWQLNSGTAEAGQIIYSTPGGYPGLALYNTGWTNQFTWANFATYGSFYFAANKNLPTLSVASSAAPEHGRVGIGQIVPTQKLEVNGGIRLNPTSVTTGLNAPSQNTTTAAPAKPACDVNARGTLWYLNNGAAKDNLQVCVYTGSAYAWTNLY